MWLGASSWTCRRWIEKEQSFSHLSLPKWFWFVNCIYYSVFSTFVCGVVSLRFHASAWLVIVMLSCLVAMLCGYFCLFLFRKIIVLWICNKYTYFNASTNCNYNDNVRIGGTYCCRKWSNIRKAVGINKGKNVCMKPNIVTCLVW